MSRYQIIDGAAQLAQRQDSTGTAARGRRVAMVAARFNADIVDLMVDGATTVWEQQGGSSDDLLLVRSPGAFELPLLARKLAQTGRFHAVIGFGCVIRGDTAHFDFVAGEAARGIADAARDTGVPVIFGVLTTENIGQALERARPERMNKGAEAMDAALEMALALEGIGKS
jgi:6,7-dimethyl-8-ribityllumazine synthase